MEEIRAALKPLIIIMEDIKEIVDSCIGNDACNFAGYRGGQPARGGNISSITNGSCVGVESCRSAAYSGFIGYIKQGCRGGYSCLSAAYGRSIDGISYACNNIKSCEFLASGKYSSVNSAVVSCCNSESECTGSIVDVSTGSIVHVSGLPSGLPVTCEGVVAFPTSSPTTEVRILSHAL